MSNNEPTGWRLVPVEPTKQMLSALICQQAAPAASPRETWAAMLSAAPQPPAAQMVNGLTEDETAVTAQVAGPLNGIRATMFHDEGAIAQCGSCGRYTLDPDALHQRFRLICECGDEHGWSGSFKKPGPDAKWHGAAPQPPAAQQQAPEKCLSTTPDKRRPDDNCTESLCKVLGQCQIGYRLNKTAAQQGEAVAWSGELPAVAMAPSEALTVPRDLLERLLTEAWYSGDAVRDVDACNAARKLLDAQPAAAPQPPAAQQPVAQGELPDDIRVPLHKLWADAGYLVGRACDGERDMAVHRIKALCDEVERAVRTALSAAPAGVAPVKMSDVAQRKAADLGRQGYTIVGYTMAKDGDRTAVLIDAAVRWLTPEQQHALMHVEGSVICAPAGVVGEPVAHMYPSDLERFRKLETIATAFSVAVSNPDERSVPLYTAPPARQALTDEQIDEEWFEVHHLPINNVAKARLFARTIERACAEAWGVTLVGIGGKGEADHG